MTETYGKCTWIFSEPAKLFLQWRLFQSQSLFVYRSVWRCGKSMRRLDVNVRLLLSQSSKHVMATVGMIPASPHRVGKWTLTTRRESKRGEERGPCLSGPG